MGNLTRLAEISVVPLSATVGPKCAKNGVCVVNQDAVTAFCNFCPSFCQSCSPPGLCINCKGSYPIIPHHTPSYPIIPHHTPSYPIFPLLSPSFPIFPHLSPSYPIFPLLSPSFPIFPLLSPSFPIFPHLSPSFPIFPHLSPSFPTSTLSLRPCPPPVRPLATTSTCNHQQQRLVNGGNHWHRVWGGGAAAGAAGWSPLLPPEEEQQEMSSPIFFVLSPPSSLSATISPSTHPLFPAHHPPQVSEMATKHHPNLVRLLGYATCGDLRERIEQILVYEFIPNGDLDKWLGKGGWDLGFGILMLVVLTGKHANFDDNGRSCFLLEWVREKLSKGSAETITDPRMGPAPPGALQRITDLAMHCTATFTADRPSMARIAQEMEALRSEVSGGEEPVHKSHKVVDAELKERMQEQKQISETMVSVLTSMNTGSMGSGSVSSFWGIREAGRTGDVSSKDAPPPEV
ncbi:unnamed protein product [Closterium sp. NIES-65]|nr:unnamed protein product [Closterium sp. NIES-65]